MNIYDFDKTIYDGDSSVNFIIFCFKKNKKCLFLLPEIIIVTCLYLIKVFEKEKLKSTLFKIVKYFDDIDSLVLEFWEKENYKLKKYYLNQRNNNDIIISASPEFLLKPVAKKYNFKLIGTKMDKKTGTIMGNNCYGEEKVKRLYTKEKISVCDNFYSDSLSDEPLAKIAKNAFIVKGEDLIDWSKYQLTKWQKIKKQFLSRDFITFVAIGVINALNGIWIAYVYSLKVSNVILAYILGFLTSLIISYLLNAKLNFKHCISWAKFGKFAISNIPNFIVQVTCLLLVYNTLNWPKLSSYAISSVIAVPITYILVKINVFKNEE